MTIPNSQCPICLDYFRIDKTAKDHYWWHKLEQLKREIGGEVDG